MEGLQLFFDRALPSCLLYPPERDQYEQMHSQQPALRPSEIYGPAHLLRCFVKLPDVLLDPKNSNLSELQLNQLKARLMDLMK